MYYFKTKKVLFLSYIHKLDIQNFNYPRFDLSGPTLLLLISYVTMMDIQCQDI